MCSHFLAGDSLRSSRRYHALDETAAFGSACRHEFPWLFINLKHGERSKETNSDVALPISMGTHAGFPMLCGCLKNSHSVCLWRQIFI